MTRGSWTPTQRTQVRLFLLTLLAVLGGLVLRTSLEMVPAAGPLSSPTAEEGAGDSPFRFDFNAPGALQGWRDLAFVGKSAYTLEKDDSGQTALHAVSRKNFSILFKVVNVPLELRPVLNWEWRAAQFPTGKKNPRLGAEGENDFALRICAIFAGNNPFKKEIIQYIWDDRFPEGNQDVSPYDENVRMLVVRSGAPTSPAAWVREKRDLVKDYEMLFGKMGYHQLRAVAVMCNSEDTQSQAEGWVRTIWSELPAGMAYVPPHRRGFKGALKKMAAGADLVRHKMLFYPKVHFRIRPFGRTENQKNS